MYVVWVIVVDYVLFRALDFLFVLVFCFVVVVSYASGRALHAIGVGEREMCLGDSPLGSP